MFDRIFGVTKAKTITAWWGYAWSVVYGRLWAFLMLLAVGALLLAPVRGQRHFERESQTEVEGILPGGLVIWGWIHFLFTLATNALLFGVIYKILPKVPVPWRDALTGGLLVSLVWILGRRLLVTFMIGTSYTAYGIVGSFIAVMIWLYYVNAILFLGAEFVESLSIVAGRSKRPVK